MKQTAVEWLMPKILELNLQLSLRRISQRNCELEILRLFEQAKEMEKQEIIETFKYAQVLHTMNDQMRGEQYYNETYGK